MVYNTGSEKGDHSVDRCHAFGVGTILDNDPEPGVFFAIAAQTLNESVGNVTLEVYFFESRVASTADAPNREEAINGIYDEFKKLGMGSLLLIDMGDEDGKKSKKETD